MYMLSAKLMLTPSHSISLPGKLNDKDKLHGTENIFLYELEL